MAFATSSLLCAVAPTTEVPIVTRILQGFAAGTRMPQVLGPVQQLFRGAERARAVERFGAGGSGALRLRLVVLAVFLVLFVLWATRYERHGKSPAVHFGLFRPSSSHSGLSIVAVRFAALPASFLMVTRAAS